VEAVDKALLQFARILASETRRYGDLEKPSDENASLQRCAGLTDVEWIARRPWIDLVNPEEYFSAYCDLNLQSVRKEHEARYQNMQERWKPLGDYVLRSMFGRIDYWTQLLLGYMARLRATKWFTSRTDSPGINTVEPWIALKQAVDQLQSTCRTAVAATRRENAVALVQVYAAYSTVPDLKWLPFDADRVNSFQALIRHVLRHPQVEVEVDGAESKNLCDPTIVRQIAHALDDATAFYEAPDDPDELIEWAKDRSRLLLVDRFPRAVYWDGDSLAESQWDCAEKEWCLLWRLAKNVGRPVSQGDLPHPEGEAIRSRRSKLSRRLIDAGFVLDELIETIPKEGYLLNLPRDAVTFLRDNGRGQLVFD